MATPIQRGWQPARSWVIVVGTLEWKDSESFSSFPKELRRDEALVQFFRRAGVPQAQVSYLQDTQATLSQIKRTFADALDGAKPDDLLFVYYCGHGYLLDSGAPLFACYDAGDEGVLGWSMTTLPAMIEGHFKGSHALLMADCCYSGCLADAVSSHRGRIAMACISSSSASELSTGNWTFTEGLLAGFGGEAFTDADGSQSITLQELAEQIQGDMAFGEEQLASFTMSGPFNSALVLGPAKPKPHPNVGHWVEVRSEGEWYKARVIDAKDGRFLVHYYGWESSDDEWVTEAQMRDLNTAQYPVGAQIEVRWKRKWYPAQVLHVRGGIHYIAYDDYDTQWNEWVASSRMRPRAEA